MVKSGVASSMASVFAVAFIVLIVQVGLYGAKGQVESGFSQVSLASSDLQIQKPYDVPQSARYSFINGVHKLWVYSTDKPYAPNSSTKPRTEIRILNHDYSSGTWQFEAYGYVPSGTTGVSIMQIFGGSPQATTLMLRVYNGALQYYQAQFVDPNIYNRWFRLNVVHNVDLSKVRVYIDGVQKLSVNGRGGTSHYFKVGVYTQNNPSNYMESRWRDIKIFKRN
ncbi:hypothetical protein Scep_018728 [Stephania cephalantha]|uniref:Alginate lyase 2 domain-containing protein n=1 Tax=Stephania cephalantha TaxID=152367 RepID=A0AAP0I9K9_9MAGN